MSNSEYAGMGLTPEELAALEAPDDESTTATQEDLEAQAAAAGADDDTTKEKANADDAGKEPGGADDGATAPAGDAGAPAAAAAEPAGEPDKPDAEPAAAASPAPQQAPIFVAKAPEDAEAKLNQIAADKASLRDKYDNGEIDFAEYEKQKDVLDEQRTDIRMAVERANTAEAMEAQRLQNQWTADCEAFLGQHRTTYDGEANKEVFAHLNETIVAFAKMPRHASLSGPELLEKAHRYVMAERGTPVAAAKAEPAAAPRKDIPKPTLPPDLGKMPAATGNDPGEGRWASIDRLLETAPEAYEAAIAKLSDADREAYLAA